MRLGVSFMMFSSLDIKECKLLVALLVEYSYSQEKLG